MTHLTQRHFAHRQPFRTDDHVVRSRHVLRHRHGRRSSSRTSRPSPFVVALTDSGRSASRRTASQTVTADSSGNFSFTESPLIPAGAHDAFNITATDTANRDGDRSRRTTHARHHAALTLAARPFRRAPGTSTTDSITSDPVAAAAPSSPRAASLASVVVGLDKRRAPSCSMHHLSRDSSGKAAGSRPPTSTRSPAANSSRAPGRTRLHFKADRDAAAATSRPRDVTVTFATRRRPRRPS